MFYPTDPWSFHIKKHQNQELSEAYVVQESSAMDFEAPKLWKGRSSNL